MTTLSQLHSLTDVAVGFRPPCWCLSVGQQHGVSIQKSTSPYISHVKNWPTFIHWPILIFLFDGVRRWRVGMLNLLYILGPLMHNNMQGLLPGWSRRPVFPRVEMLNLSYCILEALRHNTIPGLGWSKMDSAIHRINRSQPDKYWENQLCYLVESELSSG